MNRFEWTEKLATGFAEIDAQHRRLIGILDRVAMRCANGAAMTPVEVEEVISELGGYAREHFDTEIRLMLEHCCDLRHVQSHVREHEDFIRHISLVREAIADSRNDEGAELTRYLAEWFSRHIAGADLSMARQVTRIRNGTEPAAAYAAEQTTMTSEA